MTALGTRDNGFLQLRGDGCWVISSGKYIGRPVTEVAEVDIGYIEWVYEKVSGSFSDHQFYVVQDILSQKGRLR
jgi:hypothetical protein